MTIYDVSGPIYVNGWQILALVIVFVVIAFAATRAPRGGTLPAIMMGLLLAACCCVRAPAVCCLYGYESLTSIHQADQARERLEFWQCYADAATEPEKRRDCGE